MRRSSRRRSTFRAHNRALTSFWRGISLFYAARASTPLSYKYIIFQARTSGPFLLQRSDIRLLEGRS
ncbi:MAG: hypothetical protein ACTSRI_20555 [Promethearchaeota archaeon]